MDGANRPPILCQARSGGASSAAGWKRARQRGGHAPRVLRREAPVHRHRARIRGRRRLARVLALHKGGAPVRGCREGVRQAARGGVGPHLEAGLRPPRPETGQHPAHGALRLCGAEDCRLRLGEGRLLSRATNDPRCPPHHHGHHHQQGRGPGFTFVFLDSFVCKAGTDEEEEVRGQPESASEPSWHPPVRRSRVKCGRRENRA
mmetsp:Transcript_89336/g.178526  ORF Transcript_89336/g.178526 Transcript_89336/m.178526 type:complete len:204 (+) Transcript_89336:414-1025(+)